MRTAAIIAEYDPFHQGHLYLIDQAREKYGADHIIVIMSGSFVQRGGPAALPPSLRAQMALDCGVDLILQLPVYGSCASAEIFAESAVSIIDSLKLADILCFGCENDDLSLMWSAAKALADESDTFRTALNTHLRSGMSFPAARSLALSETIKNDRIADLLLKPNNILAIEYLKALIRTGSRITPCPVLRKGSGHHDVRPTDDMTASATSIRNTLRSMSPEKVLALGSLPKASAELISSYLENAGLLEPDDFSEMIVYSLRNNAAILTDFCNISEDLARRILSELDSYRKVSDFIDQIHSRNMTDTRIRRSLFSVLLNHRKDAFHAWQEHHYHGYINVLGMNRDSSHLLAQIPESVRHTMVIRPRDLNDLDTTGKMIAGADLFADNLYKQMCTIRFGCRDLPPMWKTCIIP